MSRPHAPSPPIPHDPEAEAALLAAAMLDGGALAEVRRVTPGAYYDPRHRAIAQAIRGLNGSPVDLLTVRAALEDAGMLQRVGGASYLSSLLDVLPDVVGAAAYADRVLDLAARRAVIAAATAVAAGELDSETLRRVERTVAELRRTTTGGLEDVGILLSTVEAEHVRWLWPGRIPRGKLSVLDGDPGQGKSTITLDLAARVTRGSAMPDGAFAPTGGVVLLTAEDGLGDTVRPRLDAAGADLTRVVALQTVGSGVDRRPVVLPDDIPTVRAAVQRVGAVLVVVDPIMAWLGADVDSHRDQDVRRALAQLAAMAEETGVALLVVRHLSKGGGGSNPIYRGGGSIGIIGAARAGLLVAPDPDQEGTRVLCVTKCNLAAPAPGLAYRMTERNGVVVVEWIGRSEATAAELLDDGARRGGSGRRDEAAEFLREVLGDGPLPARAVQDAARQAGHTLRTLRRATEAAGVEVVRLGSPAGGDQRWVWRLGGDSRSDLATSSRELATPGHLATSSHLTMVSRDESNTCDEMANPAGLGISSPGVATSGPDVEPGLASQDDRTPGEDDDVLIIGD